jgi:hypothetical protein
MRNYVIVQKNEKNSKFLIQRGTTQIEMTKLFYKKHPREIY